MQIVEDVLQLTLFKPDSTATRFTPYALICTYKFSKLVIIICKICYPSEFSNPVWQVDYTFSKKYPSKNTLIDAERIYELNEQLINQTSDTFWNGYAFSRETNYQPMPYNRFTLYCGMRFVDFQNFQKCTQKYSVPGG